MAGTVAEDRSTRAHRASCFLIRASVPDHPGLHQFLCVAHSFADVREPVCRRANGGGELCVIGLTPPGAAVEGTDILGREPSPCLIESKSSRLRSGQ